jgi:hypothetical protein
MLRRVFKLFVAMEVFSLISAATVSVLVVCRTHYLIDNTTSCFVGNEKKIPSQVYSTYNVSFNSLF